MQRYFGLFLILMLAAWLPAGCSDDSTETSNHGCKSAERYNEVTGRCEARAGGSDVGVLADAADTRDEGCTGGQHFNPISGRCETPRDRPDAGPSDDTRSPADANESPDAHTGDCASATTLCIDDWTMGLCANGSVAETIACGAGSICHAGRCETAEGPCSAGARTCKTDTQVAVCRADESGFDVETCPNAELCHRGSCQVLACVPGQSRCEGNEVFRCAEDGSGEASTQVCGQGETCEAGRCVVDAGPCTNQKGYLGCEFLAADLDHMRPGDSQQFGVTVSNSHTAPVEVRISTGDGAEVETRTIAVNDLQTFELPRRDVNNTGVSRQSYLVESDGPVTVHQFNPLNRASVASTDASLLLPSHALGTDYMVLGWPTTTSGRVTEGRAYATIIAPRDGTQVTVTPSAPIEAGPGVQALSAGQTGTFSLDRGQVLSLSTPNRAGLDLSGSIISSTQPVAVFFGSECADVPVGTAACDHLEQQLFPTATWGTTFVAAKFAPRGTEVDIYRLIATDDATQVSFTPAVNGTTQTTLSRGTVFEFSTSSNFVVEADKPISLGQFMVGASDPGVCTGFLCFNALGDPAYLLNVATEQYRSDYIVFVPQGFSKNYLNISAPTGASVTVDGQAPTAAPATIPGTPWQVYQVEIGPGVHRVAAGAPVGLTVHGYAQYVSYAYPGGLSLEVQ